MPTARNIPQVGRYQVLEEHDSRGASVRVIRIHASTEAVEPHVHIFSTQTYVALEGRVAITCDGVETVIAPYEAVLVPPGVTHGARAMDAVAVVMNISVPPLGADDQIAALPEPEDLRLPSEASDIDD